MWGEGGRRKGRRKERIFFCEEEEVESCGVLTEEDEFLHAFHLSTYSGA
jgi:hypothetical protein